MNTNAYKISLSYSQVLELVKQLPKKDKAKLSKELAKEAIDIRLTHLLNSFQTNELDEDTINEEVEKIREGIYAKK
ncbi:MAG: hypothetical protein JW723_07115 [Bacteroidales bacterium]|nr:hypothetical protein [Bacteroidales bacterium]